MKSFSIVNSVVLLAAIVASAWDLTLIVDDGRYVEAYGTSDSGCVNWDFGKVSRIHRVVFRGSAHEDTFELYKATDCFNLVYRNGEGNFSLTPTIARSYSVH